MSVKGTSSAVYPTNAYNKALVVKPAAKLAARASGAAAAALPNASAAAAPATTTRKVVIIKRASKSVPTPTTAAPAGNASGVVIRTPDPSHFTGTVDANLRNEGGVWVSNKKQKNAEKKKQNTVIVTPDQNKSVDAEIVRTQGLQPDATGHIRVVKMGPNGMMIERFYMLHPKATNPEGYWQNRLIPVAGDGMLPFTTGEFGKVVAAYSPTKTHSTSFRKFVQTPPAGAATDVMKDVLARNVERLQQISPSPTRLSASSNPTPPLAAAGRTPSPPALSGASPLPSSGSAAAGRTISPPPLAAGSQLPPPAGVPKPVATGGASLLQVPPASAVGAKRKLFTPTV